MANFSAGQTRGNEQEAEGVIRGAGISDVSSGLRDYVAHGRQNYSYEEATRYGLPITSGMLEGERMKAIRPAIESLELSKGEIGTRYGVRTEQLQAKEQPLKERYQVLIDELTRREGQETARTGKIMGTEYGKRGIPLSSGMYQQALGQELSDTERFYGGQQKETTLAREADLKDLTDAIQNVEQERITTMREIDQSIANLKAGAGNQAITDAMQMYKEQKQQEFDSRFDELDKRLKEVQIKGYESNLPLSNDIIRRLDDVANQYGGISH